MHFSISWFAFQIYPYPFGCSDLLLIYAKPPHGLQYTHILVSCQYILSDIDSLDYEDKHYQRRKTDLENRLYKTWNGHGYLDGEGKWQSKIWQLSYAGGFWQVLISRKKFRHLRRYFFVKSQCIQSALRMDNEKKETSELASLMLAKDFIEDEDAKKYKIGKYFT